MIPRVTASASILLLLLGATPLPAQGKGSPRAVTQACRSIVEEAVRAGVAVGLAVSVVDGDAFTLKHDADRLLIPASNMKILTVGAALLGPGPGHCILTDLVALGRLEGGVLHGDLRLRGEGDPSLEAETVLALLVERVKGAGIQRVTGGLVVDDRLFDRSFRLPSWPEAAPTVSWMAEVSALSLNHGTVSLLVTAGSKEGDPAQVRLSPSNCGVQVVNQLTTCAAPKDHLVRVVRPEFQNRITVSGRLVVGTRDQPWEVAIHDPAMVFGEALHSALARSGVVIEQQTRRAPSGEPNPEGLLLARLETRIQDLLPVLLKASQNHRAEMLFKHLGAAAGEGGSFEGGAAGVRQLLARSGLDPGAMVIKDGSGLARENRVSAAYLLAVLKGLWASPLRRAFSDSLPAGGESQGTLRTRLQDLGTRVRAKTGTLRAVSALSGYVDTKGGATLAFAILMNRERSGRLGMREAQDRLVRTLALLEEGQ